MLEKLKITLDASGKGSVVDVESGKALSNVRGISIEAGVGRLTTVKLELIAVEVEGLVEGRPVADITTIGDAWDRTRRV